MYVCHFCPLKTEMILRLKKHEFPLSHDALEQNFNTERVVFFTISLLPPPGFRREPSMKAI